MIESQIKLTQTLQRGSHASTTSQVHNSREHRCVLEWQYKTIQIYLSICELKVAKHRVFLKIQIFYKLSSITTKTLNKFEHTF